MGAVLFSCIPLLVKYVGLLIPAFSRIIKKYPDALLTIIGDGHERKALEQLVSLHSLNHNVIFPKTFRGLRPISFAISRSHAS